MPPRMQDEIAAVSASDSPGFSPRPKPLRARATNHADLLPGVDGRSAGARRYRDLVIEIVADQGGIENCASARLQLVRRFAAASVLAEKLEAEIAAGQQI